MKIIDLSEGFIEVELGLTNGKEYYSQGILFRDKTDIGVIIPTIKEIEEGLKTITIKSPLYPREFEFSVSKDFVAIRNDYLMFLPIEELECNGELKHKARVYPKEELSTIRYVMRVHFSTNSYLDNGYHNYTEALCTYIFGQAKKLLKTNKIDFLYRTEFTNDINDNFRYASVLDAKLYNGSPLIVGRGSEPETIEGIFIKNPVYMPELEELPNTGIVVFNDIIKDLIRKL